ncbi:hypothetical protein Tco_1071504 [Tanacetum coccineum]
MVEHSHNWHDEITTREKINDIPDNVDAIQASFKGAHLTKEYPLKKEDKAVEQTQEYEGDMKEGWYITAKDVERLRQIPIPTIHNLEAVVQPYMPLGLVHAKEKVVKEEEQDYDIPLHDGVMQPLIPKTVHITPLDDD